VSGPPSWKRAAGLGALGVALHVAAFPPFSLWPLALLAPWPLALLALHARSAGRAFLRLYLAGVAIFVLGSWWLAATSPVNLAIVALVDAGWFGAFGWAAHRALSRRAAWPALPVLWTAHELLRIHAPLSGYPWQLLGQALAANRVAVQAADVGGVLLLTFLAACVSAAGLGWQRHERRWAWALLLPALGVIYGLVRPHTLSEPRPGPVLAAIQPAFAQHLKEDVEAADVRYERCLDLSDQALLGGEKVDLLVWPETMWPFAMGEGEPGQEFTRGFGVDYVKQAESRFLAPLLAGGPLGDRAARLLIGTPYFRIGPDGRVLTSNSAVYFDRDGLRLGRYDKVILVPGGEAIPYARWLPAGLRRWAEELIRGIAGFVVDLEPGTGGAARRPGRGAPRRHHLLRERLWRLQSGVRPPGRGRPGQPLERSLVRRNGARRHGAALGAARRRDAPGRVPLDELGDLVPRASRRARAAGRRPPGRRRARPHRGRRLPGPRPDPHRPDAVPVVGRPVGLGLCDLGAGPGLATRPDSASLTVAPIRPYPSPFQLVGHPECPAVQAHASARP
jgi:apolipoprotein N-acyltransferase